MPLSPEVQAIVDSLGKGAASGTFAWTPPPAVGAVQVPSNLPLTSRVLGGLVATAPAGPYSLDNVGPVLQGLDPTGLDQVRRQLYTSGLMPNSYYGARATPMPFGQPLDGDTAAAFQSAARLAVFTGNLDQLLSAKANIGGLGAQGPVKQPLVIELPSAEDLHAVLKESAMPLLGRDPTPQEMAEFTARFQKLSADYQRAAYAAGGSGLPGGPGGTVKKPPSGTAAAEQYLKEKAPVEAGAQREENGLSILTKMFTGGGA